MVTEYCGDVIFSQARFLQGDKVGFPLAQFSQFSQAQDEVNEVTFATAEEFRKSKAIDCIFINYEITSTDHKNNPDLPKTLLNCSGSPKIKTHTLAYMFWHSNFNGDISHWDVSGVTNMSYMFSYFRHVGLDEYSSVTYIQGDFQDAQFKWDASGVTDIWDTYTDLSPVDNGKPFTHVTNTSDDVYKSRFKGDLSKWNVSNVTNMQAMFQNSQYKGDLSKWNVSNVSNMQAMFQNSQFNGNLFKWDVSNVTNMGFMFDGAAFNNTSLCSWDVSSVLSMKFMFDCAFKCDLSMWNISAETNVCGTFIKLQKVFERIDPIKSPCSNEVDLQQMRGVPSPNGVRECFWNHIYR
jgi:surface protein